nr:hypothetical protein GCM10025732_13280 [Glycomyces mayteni]
MDFPAPSPPSKTTKKPSLASGTAAESGRPRSEDHRSARTGTPGLSSMDRNAVTPSHTTSPAATNRRMRLIDTCTSVNPRFSCRAACQPASGAEIVMASMRMTRAETAMNANMRPRISSSVERWSSVIPARNAIPAPRPMMTDPMTEKTMCGATASMASPAPARTMLMPNQRRRESSPMSLGPKAIPAPRPRNRNTASV